MAPSTILEASGLPVVAAIGFMSGLVIGERKDNRQELVGYFPNFDDSDEYLAARLSLSTGL